MDFIMQYDKDEPTQICIKKGEKKEKISYVMIR